MVKPQFSLRRALYWLSAPCVVFGLFARLAPLMAIVATFTFFGLATMVSAGSASEEGLAVRRLVLSLMLFAISLAFATHVWVLGLGINGQ